MRTLISHHILRTVLVLSLMLGLVACNSGGIGGVSPTSSNIAASSTTTSEVSFTGSVGDGPITGATVTIYSASGKVLGNVRSDSRASFKATIKPKSSDYPLHLVATGGIDLVTGEQPDFRLASVMLDKNRSVANINPFTTLATLIAERKSGGLNQANFNSARAGVMATLSFGLDSAIVPDIVSTRIKESNAAEIVKASEAMGEMVRRTRDLIRATGRQISGDEVLLALAADMVDGFPDGLGVSGTDSTVTAVVNVVSGQVLVEALSNNLRVGGVIATGVMDQSIRTTYPNVTSSELTAGVRISSDMLAQSRIALAAAQVIDSSAGVANLSSIVDGLSANTTAGSIAGALPADSTNSLDNAVRSVSTATQSEVSQVNQLVFALYDGSPVSSSSAQTVNSSDAETTEPVTSNADGSFSVSWAAPATRSDGTALSLSDIGGYRIYYGGSAGNYSHKVDISDSTATTATIGNLVAGNYYVAMSTYDATGREGALSGSITRNIP